jgi:DNA polymerase-1
MAGLVRNMADYRELLVDLLDLGDETLAIDTETTGLRPWLDTELRGVSLAYRDKSWYLPLTHPNSENMPGAPLREALERTWGRPIFHNRNYDAAVLERGLGLQPFEHYDDTAIVSWLCDENQRHGLKAIAARTWGEDEAAEQRGLKALMKGQTQQEAYKARRQWQYEHGKESAAASREWAKEASAGTKRTWADLTAAEIADYACQDAVLTLRVFEHQKTQPEYARIECAIDREKRVQRVVYDMVKLGVAVDRDKIFWTRARNLRRAAEIEAQFEGVNLSSNPQVAKLIYEDWGLHVFKRTDTGAPSTDKEALEPLAGSHPGLDLILEHRGLTKAVSTYYDTLLENADADGRVHCDLNPVGTVTGRFSSSKPNLQNIPTGDTNPEVKAVFVAAPGYELWGFDLKSAELRVAASITGDLEMMAALDTEGVDFHTETALAVFGDAGPKQRRLSKAMNYGVPYGIGPKKMARYFVAGTGQAPTNEHYNQAKAALDAHRAKWAGLHRGIRLLSDYAEDYGRVPLHLPGRFAHFRPEGLFPVPSYHAISRVVQGGVAEFMKSVMFLVAAPAAELGARLVLQVHDSLVFEVPQGVLAALHKLVQRVADDVNPFRLRMIFDAPKAGV